jgi:hypothetical protein
MKRRERRAGDKSCERDDRPCRAPSDLEERTRRSTAAELHAHGKDEGTHQNRYT